jgi:hypothetical protein
MKSKLFSMLDLPPHAMRKKTFRSNFPHEMELIDTKIYYFCGRNLRQR